MAPLVRLFTGLGALGVALASSSRRQTTDDGLLECFQVAQPVLGPDGPTPSWANTLMGAGDHRVRRPGRVRGALLRTLIRRQLRQAIRRYPPPSCPFTNVLLTLTVLSAGHQSDRLALLYLGDTELWRTSTAEPTSSGIIWTHRKEGTPFAYLWRALQKLIFDLGNVIDEMYTGAFNTSLTATSFSSNKTGEAPADVIIPLTARRE